MPWLFSRAGVQIVDEPQAVAPDIDELRARIPRRAALGLRFTGLVGLFAAALALMAGVRPARAEGDTTRSSVRTITGYTLGGLSLGAFLVGRRLGRTSPALAVLCAGREADLDPARLAALIGGARKRLSEGSCPEAHVWLISQTPLSTDRKAHAEALKVRCFAPIDGRIIEV